MATFDADRLLDHRARRPIMHLVNGVITGLTWPTTELRAGTDDAGHDVLVLLGAEPDFEWQAFSQAVVELAHDFGARMVVALGAYPAPVPHTRGTSLSVTTSSADLSDDLHGYVRGTLDVPGGIHAVLDVAANEAGIPALGLWAQVPHYMSSMPYPAASLGAAGGPRRGRRPGARPGSTAVGQRRRPASASTSSSRRTPEHQTMVTQLEEMMDQGLGGPDDAPTFGFDDLPSGDELAEELQEFLRDRPEEG